MISHEHFTRVFDLLPQYQQIQKSDLFNLKRDGEWRHFSSTEMLDIIHETALGLLALKIKPGDKVAIISGNRPEWNFVDFAIQIIGAVSVPMYPTITVEDYAYIFENAEVKYVFVEGEDLYLKSKEASKGNKKIKGIYTFDPVEGASMWTDVKEMGEGKDRAVLQPLMDAVKPSDLLTLIYTSGTTGRPKGVMLTHHNIVSNVKSLDRGRFFELRASDKALSFLPLCHIYERTDIYMYMFYGVSVYYAESMETIADNIREVKPAMFATVPRLLEKVYDRFMPKAMS
jgi:long-chain acyl-CoA synthetase